MLVLSAGFFSTSPKKLKDEQTQHSRKKLKTQGFGKSGKNLSKNKINKYENQVQIDW